MFWHCAVVQIPHLAEGVRIHGEKVTEALRPFHERLEACFKQLKEKVEKQYGVKTLVRMDMSSLEFIFWFQVGGNIWSFFFFHRMNTSLSYI